MANQNLRAAQQGKNDEFYTQFHDIEVEMNAYVEYNPDVFRDKTILLPCDDPEWSNFTKFFALKFEEYGIKKLISTSYAPDSKKMILCGLFSELEKSSPKFDADKSKSHGKIFVLERDVTGDGHINIDDLEWDYLEGDGDFRSGEVKALRDEADIIITNPPFSLFRKFWDWLWEQDKKFIIIANKNCITYKEVFPMIKKNRVWVGKTSMATDILFGVPQEVEDNFLNTGKLGSNYKIVGGKVMGRSSSIWLANIDHGRRHEPLPLMTMADNLRYSRHKEIKGKTNYDYYDNYDAIDVPFTDAIPSDYDGAMGVPISFIDKYCPEQFEIIGLGISSSGLDIGVRPYKLEHKIYRKNIQKRGAVDGDLYMVKDGAVEVPYARILIRRKK